MPMRECRSDDPARDSYWEDGMKRFEPVSVEDVGRGMRQLRDEYTHTAGRSLASQLESEIKSSLDARMPHGWSLDDARARCQRVTYRSEPDWEYFHFDGEPMFKIGPVTSETRTENDSYIMTVKRDVVRFR